jgi:hypothetical protein
MQRMLSCITVLLISLALCQPATAQEDHGSIATVRAAQALTDARLQDISIMLTVLSGVESVQSLDWSSMQPLLAMLQDNLPPCLVWYAQPDGTYYSVDSGRIDQSLADREYFAPLLNGEEVIGAVVVGKSSGKLSAVVAVPIFHDGAVAGALGVSVFVSELALDVENSLDWPAGTGLRVLDPAGKVVFAINDGGKETGLELTSELTGWRYIALAH